MHLGGGKIQHNGFTIFEIVIVISVFMLLGATSLVSFLNSRNSRELLTSSQNVISVLQLAQARTLAGENNSSWGVRLEQFQYIIFRGTSFVSSTSTEAHVLPSNIEIVNIALSGGGQEVVFKRLSGITDQSGTFDLRVRGQGSAVFSVTIAGSGKIYKTGTAPALLGTRQVDTRHRIFNLGWSIKNSTTTTLTFFDPPNPNTFHTIDMASYFDAGKTKFDWSGTVSVGGQDQILRIHTTSLTDTNTVLSVDRNCRQNTKKVLIVINSRDIATYEADCKIITLGAWGGVMSEP